MIGGSRSYHHGCLPSLLPHRPQSQTDLRQYRRSEVRIPYQDELHKEVQKEEDLVFKESRSRHSPGFLVSPLCSTYMNVLILAYAMVNDRH